jgi:hypothetical protein
MLAPLAGKTGRDLHDKIAEVAEMYHDCRAKHDALIEYVAPK